MLFERDCQAAMDNPRIRTFMEAVSEAAGEDILTQRQFQEPRFSKFWPNCVITRYVEEMDDYEFVLMGGDLVALGGRDLTGKFISGGSYMNTAEDLRNYNGDVIRLQRPIYCCGSVDFEDFEYKTWKQVKIPFEMNGTYGQTLGFSVFD